MIERLNRNGKAAPPTDGEPPVPPGKLRLVTTYLEMLRAPTRPPVPPPAMKLALLRAEEMNVPFYRFLYDTIGERWLWYMRRQLDDAALAEIVLHPEVHISVLYAGGVPAGYVELDLRNPKDIELAYLGIMPQFIGRGLGRYLLDWAIDTAWQHSPDRLWVHTCNFDHPRALHVYQRAGFVPYRQETELIDDPRLTGLIPADVEIAVPPG
jgi:GNAT superfamily N-acetyltransferase